MHHFDRGHTVTALRGSSLASARWAAIMSMIEFRSVCKEYGRRVIDTLSLKIEAKERVVLFGPSGCGKSTILHLIAGLVIPDSGDILINGELVATAKKSLREPERRGVGMVFQDLALWPHMTVAENIEFGLEAKRLPKNKRNHRVKEMVDLSVSAIIWTLSLGSCQGASSNVWRLRGPWPWRLASCSWTSLCRISTRR
jgi:ABC-type lipoprotein export system ATPase subunit